MISKCYLVEPFTCKVNDTVADIAKKLKEYAQRHIYVVDENDKPVGLISISDILDKAVIANKNVAELTAKDVMTSDILVYEDSAKVKEAYKAMTDKKVVSCAVTENGKMVGMLTLKEAIRYVTDPKNVE